MSRRWLSILGILVFLFIFAAFLHWHGKQSATRIYSSVAAFPTGVVADGHGNIYVVAHKQNRILEVSSARHVTIIAGNGRTGFGGDGGPAEKASLDAPIGIALDHAGNLFIADTNNNRIRRVDAKTHIITTMAGNGYLGSGAGTLATATALYQPVSVAIDSNENLYIGGMGIQRVDAITDMTSKLIPTTKGAFWVAVDEHGRLFYSDPNHSDVSQVSYPEKSVHRIAGSAVCGFSGDGGQASGALLCFPEALSFRSDQEIFIADTGNNRIRRVDLSSGVIATVAGNGQAGYAGDGGLAVNASLNGPMGISVDEKGDVYIADTGNNCIRLLHTKTGTITTLVSNQDLASASLEDEGK